MGAGVQLLEVACQFLVACHAVCASASASSINEKGAFKDHRIEICSFIIFKFISQKKSTVKTRAYHSTPNFHYYPDFVILLPIHTPWLYLLPTHINHANYAITTLYKKWGAKRRKKVYSVPTQCLERKALNPP